MMRTILVATLIALCSITAHAQSNAYRTRGYKGNVALGINGDVSCGGAGYGFFTTHGMQVNSLFFIGGGMGYENEMFPIYSDFRSYFVKKRMRVNPWIEIKLGVDALNGGCYLSPSFGLSVPLAKDYAFSVAFAYGSNPSYGENNIGLRITFQF